MHLDPTMMKDLQVAEASFMAGHFNSAAERFQGLLEQDAQDPRVLLRLGQLALFEHQPVRALDYFRQCDELGFNADAWLAEAYYRADDFPRAAAYYQQCGRQSIAQHLAGFRALQPYRLCTGPDQAVLEFLAREPLPLVRVQINGLEEALFLLDTGAWDTVVDIGLAERAGLQLGPHDLVHCAGGRRADVRYSRLACLGLGALEIADVPAQVMALDAALDGFFDPHGVDGILGLAVLSRFAITLDMQVGELRLARHSVVTPDETLCWFGSGRQLLAWGEINQQPNLWFVDTGMMGFDCLVPPSTAAQAHLQTEPAAIAGYGGGGQLALNTAPVEQLSLGGFNKRAARAVIGGFDLERQYGYRIGGLLSAEFLKRTVLAVDFLRMRLSVQPLEC